MFVLPIARDNIVRHIPWVVICLIGVNTAIYGLTLFGHPAQLYQSCGFIPARPHLSSVFFSMFIHSSFWHLLGNMFFLWMFGIAVENSLRPVWFSLCYLCFGFTGSALHYVLNLHSTIPCVGASGAISGLLGAYFVMFPHSKFNVVLYFGGAHLKTVKTQTWAALGIWFGMQTLLGLISKVTGVLSVTVWAQMGGFLGGLVAGALYMVVVPEEKRQALMNAKPWYMRGGQSLRDSKLTILKL